MNAITLYIVLSTIFSVIMGIIWSNKGVHNSLIKWFLLLMGVFGVVIMVKSNIINLVF